MEIYKASKLFLRMDGLEWCNYILSTITFDSNSLSQINKVFIGICIFYASKRMYDTLVYKTGAVPSEYFSLKKRPAYKDYQKTTSQFFPRSK